MVIKFKSRDRLIEPGHYIWRVSSNGIPRIDELVHGKQEHLKDLILFLAIHWCFGKWYFPVQHVASTPVPIGESVSNTPNLMEIYPKDGVGSFLLYRTKMATKYGTRNQNTPRDILSP